MSFDHHNAQARETHGTQREKEFQTEVKCHCGKGSFESIGHLQAGWPDFTCDYCGQLVDVKGGQVEQTGNVAISATPFAKYSPDTLIATKVRGQWIGQYREAMQPLNTDPLKPTHKTRPTRFYLFSTSAFESLSDLGYKVHY